MAKPTALRRPEDSKKPKSEEDLEVDEVMDDDDEVAVTYDIASYPSDLTLSVIYEMWNNGDIEIPEFQRIFLEYQAVVVTHRFLLARVARSPGLFSR